MQNQADTRIERIRGLLPEIAQISDESLRSTVETIWERMWAESGWGDIADIPKNPSAPGAPQRVPDAWTLVTHTRAVAQLALTSAETVKTLHGIPYDHDALLAIALLHDVSKIVEYEGTREKIQKGHVGRLIQHGVYGAFMMWQHGLPTELVHGVIAHTPSSRGVPQTHEALIVRYVDFLDTDSMLLDAGEELYLK
ncbi:HD domain-containing protein [Nonomuraea sp. K274]|uniref:HD domain-containing protein n=1 Tax=Nonomuraea cypriaca TaxID=1187855 RepID=A0A931A8S5_9ACTN|nr:HD domain-containing protein [Nonomuraea cypriaca]MBF8188356.1 HD domain-containing protein [Nonomuraea cypriaca]